MLIIIIQNHSNRRNQRSGLMIATAILDQNHNRTSSNRLKVVLLASIRVLLTQHISIRLPSLPRITCFLPKDITIKSLCKINNRMRCLKSLMNKLKKLMTHLSSKSSPKNLSHKLQLQAEYSPLHSQYHSIIIKTFRLYKIGSLM